MSAARRQTAQSTLSQGLQSLQARLYDLKYDARPASVADLLSRLPESDIEALREQAQVTDAVMSQVSEREAELHGRQQQVEQNEKQLAQREDQLVKQQKELAEQRVAFESTSTDIETLLQNLRQLLASRDGERINLESELTAEQARYKKIKSSIKSLQEQQKTAEQATIWLLQEFEETQENLEITKERIAKSESELALLEQEHQKTQERLGQLVGSEERLRFLAGRLDEMRLQIAEIEMRLEPHDVKASDAENLLRRRSEELIVLSQETLEGMYPEIQEALLQARQKQQELNQSAAELRDSQKKYENASTLRDQRLAALRLHHQADETIAHHRLIAAHCPSGSTPAAVLDEIETMLQAVDSALGMAIQANETAQNLEVLRPDGI